MRCVASLKNGVWIFLLGKMGLVCGQ